MREENVTSSITRPSSSIAAVEAVEAFSIFDHRAPSRLKPAQNRIAHARNSRASILDAACLLGGHRPKMTYPG